MAKKETFHYVDGSPRSKTTVEDGGNGSKVITKQRAESGFWGPRATSITSVTRVDKYGNSNTKRY